MMCLMPRVALDVTNHFICDLSTKMQNKFFPTVKSHAHKKSRFLFLSNLTSCLNALISHMKTKYKETSFIKVLEL